MVATLSSKKKSQAAFWQQLLDAIPEFSAAARVLAEAIDRDAAAFDAVMAAARLPKGTPEEQAKRDGAIAQATRVAAEVPMRVAETSLQVYEQLGQLEGMASASMLSDLRVGRLMAAAAVRGALENVAINLQTLSDAEFVGRMRAKANEVELRLAESPVSAGK
jgi:formiminotetrahydrofolate cyclodeaminase